MTLDLLSLSEYRDIYRDKAFLEALLDDERAVEVLQGQACLQVARRVKRAGGVWEGADELRHSPATAEDVSRDPLPDQVAQALEVLSVFPEGDPVVDEEGKAVRIQVRIASSDDDRLAISPDHEVCSVVFTVDEAQGAVLMWINGLPQLDQEQ